MWKLVIEDDEGKRTVVTLTRDEYSIGRREGNIIRLTERNVSRDHARIYKKAQSPEQERFAVEDRTSYNGVFVNGLRISHAQDLGHGDLIQVGDYRIVVQDEALADDAEPVMEGDWKQTVPSAPQSRAAGLLDRPNRLVMLAGPAPGTEFPLDRERMTIGRAEDATVSVNHNSVSRLHCEVHALGDGRFEIVDKGSSNGVRVNGADLRRGIVEPGDIIELGDVRFKFVGAGQIFRPAGGQEFTMLSARKVSAARAGHRYRSLPVAVFAVVVAAGGVGAWAYTRPRMRALAPAAASSPEQAVLAEARKQCDKGNCEAAHAKLDATLPKSSRWRDTEEFREVESRWAESVIARADGITDVSAKRDLYNRVAQTIGVDPAHRVLAADRLQQLDANSGAEPTNALDLSRASSAPSKNRDRQDASAAATRGDATRRNALVAAQSPSSAPVGATTAVAAPGTGGVEDRERQLALLGTPDSKLALKQQLEPRVYGGKASDAEVRLLISTCKDLGDKGCVQQARAVLAQRRQ
jgi:pSer/pThr/pTyr-binding forkhead associated (FHA) protein